MTNQEVVGGDPLKAALPSVRAEVQSITHIARALEALVVDSPTLMPFEYGKPETSQVHEVSASDLTDRINKSVRALVTLAKYCGELNRLGSPNEDRSSASGAELMPLALLHIVDRYSNGAHPHVSPNELLLSEIYSRKNGEELDVADWFLAARPFVNLQGGLDTLPGVEVYVEASDGLREKHAGLCEELSMARGEVLRMRLSPRQSEGPTGDSTIAKIAQVEQLEESLMAALRTTEPIDPTHIAACTSAIQVSAEISPLVLQAAIALHNDIGRLIPILAKATSVPASGLTVEAPELVLNGNKGNVARIRINAQALFTNESNSLGHLAQLLTNYADIREMLFATRQSWIRRPDVQTSQKSLVRNLEDAVSSLFSSSAEITRKTISALATSDHPGIQEASARVLTANVKLHNSTGGSRVGTVLELPENVQVLARVIATLVKGNDSEVAYIKDALAQPQGALKPVVELALKTRKLYQIKNPVGLAKLFDHELKEASVSTSVSYEKRIGILLVMSAVSEDARLSKNMRGFLKDLEKVSDVATRISENFGKSTESAAAFVEELRAGITDRLSKTLRDYLGQEKLVSKLKRQLEDSILLSKHPEAWEGLPPNQVIYSGYLLVGKPGIGKTHLVVCMMNTLGISLVRVTGEELHRAFNAAVPNNSSGQPERADMVSPAQRQGLADLVKEKVQKIEKEREKSKAPLKALFLDELEALFLDRRNLGSAAHSVASVNAMLTAVEEVIAEEAGIIFVGATNYLKMVDEAGTRRGRFGLILQLDETTEVDAKIIIKDCLDFQEVQLDLEAPEFHSIFKEAVGLNVLPLQQAIHRACSIKRARAIEQGASAKDPISISAEELKLAVLESKEFERIEIEKKLAAVGGL